MLIYSKRSSIAQFICPSFEYRSCATMCSKRKSWEYYLSKESKSDAKESLSCFSLNLSELSTKTAIRNVTEPSCKAFHTKLSNNAKISHIKCKERERIFLDASYQSKNHKDSALSRKFDKVSNYSYSMSDFSAKLLPRNISQTSHKTRNNFVNTDKQREIERHNEHFMKKLQRAKPTTDIKKSTSEVTVLQVRSEKHVPAASIRRRHQQAEINAKNEIIQKKLNAIASKKM